MKNKIVIGLLTVGVILIGIGVIFRLDIFKNNEKEKEPIENNITPTSAPIETDVYPTDAPTESETNEGLEENDESQGIIFTGRYSSSNGELLIYQNGEYDLYFATFNNIYGKATITDKTASGKNNNSYKITLNNDNSITLESSNTAISGTYKKTGNITLDEFYNSKYGNKEFAFSMYNGYYYNNDVKVRMIQYNNNEVYGFFSKNSNNKLIKMTINDDKTLSYSDGGINYKIELVNGNNGYKEYLTITNSDSGSLEQKLMFDGEIDMLEFIDLYNDYQ